MGAAVLCQSHYLAGAAPEGLVAARRAPSGKEGWWRTVGRRRRALRPRQSSGARARREAGVWPAGGLLPSKPPAGRLP